MQKVGTSPKGSTPSTGDSRSIACNWRYEIMFAKGNNKGMHK